MTDLRDNEEAGAAKVGPLPPFDAELAAPLTAINEHIPATVTIEMLPQLREMTRQRDLSDDELSRNGTFEVSTLDVPGPKEAPDIELLVCRPKVARGMTPVIYYIHSGGMVMGSNRGQEITGMLDIAEQLDITIVAPSYRLAPEHPHPAPGEDCYAGLSWTMDHAEELRIDADAILIAGSSGGGGLAAATALLARDRGGPRLVGQVLVCPMLDNRNDSVSAQQTYGIGIWDRRSNQMGWDALLGAGHADGDISGYAAPARAEDVSGLPPAFIDVGSAETFRDEAVRYASRLWQAGGQAELHVWPGGFHGFHALVPQAAVSQAANDARAAWVRRTLATST